MSATPLDPVSVAPVLISAETVAAAASRLKVGRQRLKAFCVAAMRVNKKLARGGAEAVERQNLGYYAGYYNVHTQERVEKLFGAVHPVFGSVEGPQLTAQQVFDRGVAEGAKSRG